MGSDRIRPLRSNVGVHEVFLKWTMPGREGFMVFGVVRGSDPETVAVLPSSDHSRGSMIRIPIGRPPQLSIAEIAGVFWAPSFCESADSSFLEACQLFTLLSLGLENGGDGVAILQPNTGSRQQSTYS